MSPRAASRLDTLGFEQVYDYVAGKADWLANGLPREGETAATLYTGDLVDPDPPVCSLTDTVPELREILDRSSYGFCLAVNERRVVLGRVRASALEKADAGATAESIMEEGPGTVRPKVPAVELLNRLVGHGLKSAVVTTPQGRLLGVAHREVLERRVHSAEGSAQ
jgi:CBS domain-containing protein